MTYLLQVSTCWIVFFAIYILFLQKETFFSFNRYYLLGALFLGLGIPFIGGFLPANHTSTEVYLVMSQVATMESSTLINESQSSFNWLSALYIVYGIGVVFVSSRFIYGLSRIYRIYGNASKTTLNGYTLIESNEPHLPFSFFHFIFISKKLPLQQDVDKILKHEELHVHQWHSIDIIILELLHTFFWFNPVLIFYKKALKQSHEYLADAYVLREHKKSSYGQLLLRQSKSGLEIALANHFFHSQIKKRITMMYKEKSKRPAMVKYLAAIPVLIGLLVLFASSKSNDQIQNNGKDCLEIKVDKDGFYTHLERKVVLYDIETMLSKDATIECMNLILSPEAKTSAVTKVLNASYKYNTPAYLKMSKTSKGLQSSLEERKIVQRKQPAEILDKGSIAVLVEADKKGDVIYVQLLKDETSIRNKESQRKVMDAVKQFKFEPANSNSIGKLKFEYETLTEDTELTIETIDMHHPEKSEKSTYNNTELTKASKDLFGLKKSSLNETQNEGEPIFKVVEEMPRFPGCEDENLSQKEKDMCSRKLMLNYIFTNMKYPQEAKDANIEGMCVIQFIVEKDGSISEGKIVRDIGAKCGETALATVTSMPTWIPGKQRGKNVRVQYTLPVRFALEGPSSSDSKNQKQFDPNHVSDKLKKVKENLMKNGTKKTLEADVFRVVEEMPRFVGCENENLSIKEKDSCAKGKMLEYIYSNLRYPENARNLNIQGTAVIQMIINTDGAVTNVNVVRDPGEGLGDEAKKVIEGMPNWIPGKQQGKVVKVQYTLPIKFKLDDKKDSANETKNRESVFLKLNDFVAKPNPSNGMFELSFSSEEKAPATIIFFATDGKIIKTIKDVQTPFNQRIDLSEIQAQTVFIKVIQNGKVFSEKILVQ